MFVGVVGRKRKGLKCAKEDYINLFSVAIIVFKGVCAYAFTRVIS